MPWTGPGHGVRHTLEIRANRPGVVELPPHAANTREPIQRHARSTSMLAVSERTPTSSNTLNERRCTTATAFAIQVLQRPNRRVRRERNARTSDANETEERQMPREQYANRTGEAVRQKKRAYGEWRASWLVVQCDNPAMKRKPALVLFTSGAMATPTATINRCRRPPPYKA
jgi:hypothetical protein